MPPKKKPAAKKATRNFNIKFTPQEQVEFKALAGHRGMNLSALVRLLLRDEFRRLTNKGEKIAIK